MGFGPVARRMGHWKLCGRRSNRWGSAGFWDVDVQKYFDRIDHGQLREFLARRVRDGVIRRLIDKWLKAGVWESGRRWVPGEGTPQGGVVSPLLSNIYLHEVMDVWFDREVRPRLQGRAAMFRFADDFVLVFKLRQDAERVLGSDSQASAAFWVADAPGENPA